MSKELLKQIGEHWYGGEWQAPLARELDVNERSMRRWVAGTDPIPPGVWRDIWLRLEARNAKADQYVAELQSMLSQTDTSSAAAADSPPPRPQPLPPYVANTDVSADAVRQIAEHQRSRVAHLDPIGSPIGPLTLRSQRFNLGEVFESPAGEPFRRGIVIDVNKDGTTALIRFEETGAEEQFVFGDTARSGWRRIHDPSNPVAWVPRREPPKTADTAWFGSQNDSGGDVARAAADRRRRLFAATQSGPVEAVTPPQTSVEHLDSFSVARVREPDFVRTISERPQDALSAIRDLTKAIRDEIAEQQANKRNDFDEAIQQNKFISFLEQIAAGLDKIAEALEAAIETVDKAKQPIFLGKAGEIAAQLSIAVKEGLERNRRYITNCTVRFSTIAAGCIFLKTVGFDAGLASIVAAIVGGVPLDRFFRDK